MAKPVTTLETGDRGRMSPNRNGPAITLMELLVVLSIIAAIVGMGVPAMARYSAQVRLKAAVRQAAGFLSLARSLSIGSEAGHTVIVDAPRRLMTVVDNASGEMLEQKFHLPQGIDIQVTAAGEAVTPPEIAFQPSGSLRGRTTALIFKDQEKSVTITVSAVTGAISIDAP